MSEVTIGSLAADESGAFKIGPFGSSLKKSELVETGIPVAGIENVLPNEFIFGFRRFITSRKFQQLSDYEIRAGDVLVTTMGTIGRAAVAPEHIGTVIIDSHLFRMRVDRNKVEPAYLCYAINGYEGLLRQLAARARGAIMDGLNTKILRGCTIPLPAPDRQREIVEMLRKVEKLRKQQREADRQTEHLFESLLRRAFYSQ